MSETTLGRYFYECHKRNVIDFRLRINEQDGVIHFYIHPFNRDGVTADFYVVGNLALTAMVNGVISDFPTALQADCKSFAPMPESSCPKCSTVLQGYYLEKPWFVALDGGKEPGTPNGPGEYWTEGIQTCPECGHQWEVQA